MVYLYIHAYDYAGPNNSLKNTIGSGFTAICSATCPKQGCNVKIGRDTYERVLSKKEVEIYENALYDDFIKHVEDGEVIHCPKPRCCQIIVGSIRKRTVVCANGHRFCYKCKGPPHAPVSCGDTKKWEALCAKAGGEENVDMLKQMANNDIKPCPNPKCNVATQKISGCMYLHCSSCKCNWCWQCGQWGGKAVDRPEPHHVHQCNQPKNENWRKFITVLFLKLYQTLTTFIQYTVYI